ncbi:hypothetical protein [Aeoliella mucimassa]|uniref:Carboxypeptidase regulatory-like domain-containing protein n=1 Tax=Aeoliella mucimassa TaxID=2527972 RepID=A0A518AMS7_9BACT|nr:hypothetical protein [Aeoliella mucimassa]QDU56034.1 hypothetical protein Pan181_22360 [Aeoliella mucimassa]
MSSFRVSWPSGLLFAALLATMVGCGRSSDIDKVVLEGTITLDGQGIPNGEIRFFPIEKTQGPVSGGPIKDGHYVAKSRGGVPVGKHRVEIQAYRPGTQSAGSGPGSSKVEGGPAEPYLPAKYNTNSELTCTVSSDSKTQDFALHSM